MFDAPQRRCSQQGPMEVEEPWRAWHGPGSDSDTASTARIQPKLYATPDGEALPEEAQELLRSLGQAWETPSKAELRHCRAMLGRQAEQLQQYGQIRRLRSSPSYSQAQSALCMEDAQCEISCLRASIKRREAEVHVAQVELAYLNTLVAQKDLQLQKAEKQLVTPCSTSSEAPQSVHKRIAKEEIEFAEAEAEQMIQPLVAVREASRRDPLERLSSLDGDIAVSTLSAAEIDTATAAGQRVLASLRRAREALEQSPCSQLRAELGGLSVSP